MPKYQFYLYMFYFIMLDVFILPKIIMVYNAIETEYNNIKMQFTQFMRNRWSSWRRTNNIRQLENTRIRVVQCKQNFNPIEINNKAHLHENLIYFYLFYFFFFLWEPLTHIVDPKTQRYLPYKIQARLIYCRLSLKIITNYCSDIKSPPPLPAKGTEKQLH